MVALPPDERQRLCKLLCMTASNSDGEALTAIRKANELINRHKKHWMDFFEEPPPSPSGFREYPFNSRPYSPSPPESQSKQRKARQRQEHKIIEEAFKLVKGQYEVGTRKRKLLDSFWDQWLEKGYLTEKQLEVLLDIASIFRDD